MKLLCDELKHGRTPYMPDSEMLTATNNGVISWFNNLRNPGKGKCGYRSGNLRAFFSGHEGRDADYPVAYLISYETLVAVSWGDLILVDRGWRSEDERAFSTTTSKQLGHLFGSYIIDIPETLTGAKPQDWVDALVARGTLSLNKLPRVRTPASFRVNLSAYRHQIEDAQRIAREFGAAPPALPHLEMDPEVWGKIVAKQTQYRLTSDTPRDYEWPQA